MQSLNLYNSHHQVKTKKAEKLKTQFNDTVQYNQEENFLIYTSKSAKENINHTQSRKNNIHILQSIA